MIVYSRLFINVESNTELTSLDMSSLGDIVGGHHGREQRDNIRTYSFNSYNFNLIDCSSL